MHRLDSSNPIVLAVDIGGTKIMTSLITSDGRMLATEVSPTLAGQGPEAIIQRLFVAIDSLLAGNNLETSRLHSISMAVAGAIDSARGLVTFSPNLPGWHDTQLADMISERFGVRTFLVNDASAAALGEHRFGAGKGVSDLILLTLGTGIGGGIIIDGELYLGACGSAAEIGHMVIDVNGPDCACGNKGCLEALASGTAIAREAINRIGDGESSSLVTTAQGDIKSINAEQVSLAARAGDALALDIFSRASFYLGVGMASLVNIFNPEMIVLGGGMVELKELLIGPATEVMKGKAFQISAQAVRVVTARLGEEAGVYGAAAFPFNSSGG